MDNINKCKCPICKQNFTPEKGVTPEEHLAKGTLKVFAEMQHFPHVHELPCPRCGRMEMREKLVENARSRHFDIHICCDCGTDEALRDYKQNVLPLFAWNSVNSIMKCFSGIDCENYIPEKGNPYPLCDNPKCKDSKKCNISAYWNDDY